MDLSQRTPGWRESDGAGGAGPGVLICAIKILLPNFCSYCVLTDAGADVSRRRLPAQVPSVVLSFLPVPFDASRANRRVVFRALQVCVNTLTAALLVRPLKCPTHVRHLRKQWIFSSRHLATNQHVRVCILVASRRTCMDTSCMKEQSSHRNRRMPGGNLDGDISSARFPLRCACEQ